MTVITIGIVGITAVSYTHLVAAYLWLIEEKKYAPEKIIIAGDSAGGGLTLALTLYLRDHSIPMPAGIIVMSPWADLTCSGESYTTNYSREDVYKRQPLMSAENF